MTPYPPLKVERDMPFAKKGDVFSISRNGNLYITSIDETFISYGFFEIKRMIKDGWLSEVVEEKTLVEKFHRWTIDNHRAFDSASEWKSELCKAFARMSNTAHLKAFDRAAKEWERKDWVTVCAFLEYLRKALEDVVK